MAGGQRENRFVARERSAEMICRCRLCRIRLTHRTRRALTDVRICEWSSITIHSENERRMEK